MAFWILNVMVSARPRGSLYGTLPAEGEPIISFPMLSNGWVAHAEISNISPSDRRQGLRCIGPAMNLEPVIMTTGSCVTPLVLYTVPNLGAAFLLETRHESRPLKENKT